MISLEPAKVKKEMSMYEIKSSLEMIDERIKELLAHRGEVSCGGYEWDSGGFKEEYFKLKKVRKKLRGVAIQRAVVSTGL